MRRASPDEFYDELFVDVQQAKIFGDSKTFCDAIPQVLAAKEILRVYREEKPNPKFDLAAFVAKYFRFPSSKIIHQENQTIVDHCHRLWPLLTRESADENEESSLIGVPHPFIVPGGRFQEFYYWDTFFSMLGLVRSNQLDLAANMLKNFAFLVRTLGHIPNGNRWYYKGRSQPPFFVLMTELLGRTNEFRAELELEYRFWMEKRSVRLDDGTILNRYFDDEHLRPRPEAFREDFHLATNSKRDDLYLHLRAAAESGWDFSSRWLDDANDLSTIDTANILPVDLNCLLFHLEMILGKTTEAERRRQAIEKYFWSTDDEFFTDFHLIKKKSTGRLTLAGLFPLWFEIATRSEAEKVARRIEKDFLRDGGLVTTIVEGTGQQWDYPNGWAPLQYVGYRALLKVEGFEGLARTIRSRWMALNERVFASTGKMMEKYDVVDMTKLAGGGEYANQDGFGWTNGVYLEMFHDRQNSS